MTRTQEPKFYYFIVNAETRQHMGTGAKTTKRAARSELRHQRRKGRECFIAPIPASEVMAYHAAYLRQHGTLANPRSCFVDSTKFA